jgi:hypothetical protein
MKDNESFLIDVLKKYGSTNMGDRFLEYYGVKHDIGELEFLA